MTTWKSLVALTEIFIVPTPGELRGWHSWQGDVRPPVVASSQVRDNLGYEEGNGSEIQARAVDVSASAVYVMGTWVDKNSILTTDNIEL